VSKNIESQAKESSLGMSISILIVIGALVLFYLDPLKLNTTLYKVLFLLVGLVLASFVFLKSPQGIRLNAFLKRPRLNYEKLFGQIEKRL